ncbi:hypothetical protein [Companilactobacillus sp. DQM5]|uniref:hypothetical protein n=1 Tax=Companilactobacillus sp. DQM5 TaxID=3463359 RepID=UPI004058653C
MSLSLTLGSKKLLKDFSKPHVILNPINLDEASMRVEFSGTDYQEISQNNFSWNFSYYRFIYLKFNKEQKLIFENMMINKKIQLQNYLIIKNDDSFVIIVGSNSSDIDYANIKKLLIEKTTNNFGFFSKLYVND